jgi:hypothetical protein
MSQLNPTSPPQSSQRKPQWANVPRITAGVAIDQREGGLYGAFVLRVDRVSSPRTADLAKLLEISGSYAGPGVSEYARHKAARRAGMFARGSTAMADQAGPPAVPTRLMGQDGYRG